jgi:large repetitive protein
MTRIRPMLLAAAALLAALAAAAPANAATGGAGAGIFDPAPSALALATSADLSVTSSDAPDPVAIGQNLIYSVTVHNGGPDAATAAQLIDPLPSGTTFVSATTDVGTCAEASGTVTCDLGDLPANGDANVTITVTATAAVDASITNTVTAASASDTNSSNDQATTETAILPDLTTGDATVGEGDSGTTDAVFTISLSHATSQPVTFHYATADITTTAGVDYTSTSGDATIPAGSLSTTVSVPVKGDTLHEETELFELVVTAVGHATLLNGDGIGRITDEDAPPSLSIADAAVTEGNSGTANATFVVSLSAVSGAVATVHYETADGTATQPGDYTAASGDLTFNPGETSKSVTVHVNGDPAFEADETFAVTLSAPTGAAMDDAAATGTIVNDDSPSSPVLSISDATVGEGNAGTVAESFTISTPVTSSSPITFTYATSDGTATAGSDYTATTATGAIPAGQSSTTVTVPVRGDTLDEPDETYAVDLSGVGGAGVLDGHAVGTIADDDAQPALLIADATVTEGNSGSQDATFGVSLSAPSGKPVQVHWATADGTATQPGDYAAASGDVAFAPGETSKFVTVHVNGDTSVEPDEGFAVNLSSPVNATLVDGQATGTIRNDDAATTPVTPVPKAAAPAIGASTVARSVRIGRICRKPRHRMCPGVSGRTLFGAATGRVTWDLSATLTMRSGKRTRHATLHLGRLDRALGHAGALAWQVKLRTGTYAKLARRFAAARHGELVVRITYRPGSGAPVTKVLRIRLAR